MSHCRDAGKYTPIFILALSLSGCLKDSAESNPGATEAGAVSVAITTPTSASTMDSTDATVKLAGTASSDFGIARVSWTNSRGGQGNANGAENWQTSDIVLELGENTITVTAEDSAGSTKSHSIVINRESKQPGSLTLSWNAPTQRTDGTPLENLAGFKIYYGRMSEIYDYVIEIDHPGLSSYTVEELVPGEWYFTLAAFDADGIESDRSNEVPHHID